MEGREGRLFKVLFFKAFLVSKVRIYGRVDNDEIHFVFVLLLIQKTE